MRTPASPSGGGADRQRDLRTLDELDPPAWPSTPPQASSLVERCHSLRTVPVAHFTPDDLRVMIGQRVALPVLVPVALDLLRSRPQEPGVPVHEGLLQAVRAIPAGYWTAHPDDARLFEDVAQTA